MSGPLLRVKDLAIAYGATQAVVGLSFEIFRGKTLALVGESGSGKSSVGLALPRLLPREARVTGQAVLRVVDTDVDLLALPQKQLSHYRGCHIGVVFQEPMTALNPLQRVGAQVAEALQIHQKLPKKEALARVVERFREVELPTPEALIRRYPHQLSGGQRQRVVIALALANRPALVVADEPTTALDPTVQRRVLQLLKDLQARYGFGLVFISHDLPVVGAVADDVIVLRKGVAEEKGRVGAVLGRPEADYTQRLLAAAGAHASPLTPQPSTEIAIRAEAVSVCFGKGKAAVNALKEVSLAVQKGETLGIVGESGSGKSTLARVLVGLQPTQTGQVFVNDFVLHQANKKQIREFRRRVQLVFQDPYAALTPHQTIGAAFDEVLRVHGFSGSAAARKNRAIEVLEDVGMPAEALARYPFAFSGGQRQRLCIARALLVAPDVIVLDEAVSALDATLREQVLELLTKLKTQHGLTYVFISHDLQLVQAFCHRTAVLQAGTLIQIGPTEKVLTTDPAPYTQTLLAAMFQLGGSPLVADLN